MTGTPSRNPFVFVVGCPRSGTTLLKRMIDAHPDIAITPETHWIPRFHRRRIGVDDTGRVTDELVPALLAYGKFANLKIPADEVRALVAGDQPVLYAEFVSRLFDLYGRRCGKTLVGDKTPGYVRRIGLLHELWPSARFVHLIRDGRDVCLSVLNWKRAHRNVGRYETWDDDPVTTVALWWERFILDGRAAAAALPSGFYHEIHYEQLVEDPEVACRALCTFLGLPFDDHMVRFHEGRTKPERGRAKGAWLPVTRGLRDWREQLVADDVQRFEAAAGATLEQLGYPRGCDRPDAAVTQRVAAVRARFERDAARPRSQPEAAV